MIPSGWARAVIRAFGSAGRCLQRRQKGSGLIEKQSRYDSDCTPAPGAGEQVAWFRKRLLGREKTDFPFRSSAREQNREADLSAAPVFREEQQ